VTERIREAAGTATMTGNRFLVTLITPGWGSSGYYSKEALQKAAADKVFPAGTLMHIDHATMQDEAERPAGSLKTLAGALTEDARYEGGKLVAEARGIHPWKEALVDAAEFIGVSISAAAEISLGEAEGQKGRIIEALEPHPFNRVDFVTLPGRGGKYQVLESASPATAKEARNIGQWLEARLHSMFTNLTDEFYGDGRLTREERITLSNGLGGALAALTATVEAEAPQLFDRDLWDEPQEPSATESKESPADPAGVTENKKEEAAVATIQIEEAELTQLRESASRATALEAENTELRQAEEARAEEAHKASIEGIVAEAFKGISATRAQSALVAEALAGKYDAAATKAAAEEAAAEYASVSGAGKPAGLGSTAPVQESATAEPTADDIVATLKGA
jgi:hypothetical protein